MPHTVCAPVLVLLAGLALAAGCRPADESSGGAAPGEAQADEGHRPVLATYADTVAMRAYEAGGGPAAWAALPYLRFNFGAEVDGTARPAVRHFWDRRTGDYRVELPGGEDTTYVVLFNVNTRAGQAYLDGAPLDSTANAQKLEQAYGRFINDTYWLLAPFKLFDPGVRRAYAADSSDADTDVLHLAFENVGLTPGDQYWLYIDKATGRLEEWAYALQSGRKGRYRWAGYEEHAAPGGPIRLASRKPAVGGTVAILTDHIGTPAAPPDGIFSDPRPRL